MVKAIHISHIIILYRFVAKECLSESLSAFQSQDVLYLSDFILYIFGKVRPLGFVCQKAVEQCNKRIGNSVVSCNQKIACIAANKVFCCHIKSFYLGIEVIGGKVGNLYRQGLLVHKHIDRIGNGKIYAVNRKRVNLSGLRDKAVLESINLYGDYAHSVGQKSEVAGRIFLRERLCGNLFVQARQIIVLKKQTDLLPANVSSRNIYAHILCRQHSCGK